MVEPSGCYCIVLLVLPLVLMSFTSFGYILAGVRGNLTGICRRGLRWPLLDCALDSAANAAPLEAEGSGE